MRRTLTASITALVLALQPAAVWAARAPTTAPSLAAPVTAATAAERPAWATMVQAQYVRSLYADVLERRAAPEEVQSWVDDLGAGRSRRSVAEGFLLSAESLELTVRRNSADILGRRPSSDEVSRWGSWVRDYESVTVLQTRLLVAEELIGAVTRQEWITKAYRTLSGTGPTADELAARSAQLSAGRSHAAVAREISDTPKARLWRFNALFQQLLGRNSTRSEQIWYAAAGVFADVSYRRSVLASEEYVRAAQRWMFQCYARSLYEDVLGRPAEPSGVVAYTDSLVKGASAQQVASAFVHSTENVERVIRDAFTTVLGRAPDAAELSAYSARMSDRFGDEHWSRTRVLVRLMLTGEFRGRYSGRAWIQQAYRILLDRTAGETEIDGWMPTLSAGGHSAVAEGIATSEEARRLVVTAAYRTLLGRPADPDGLVTWTTRLGQAPSNLAENAEFVAYAQEIGGQVLVSQLIRIAADALGVGLIMDALTALALPDIPVKIDRLQRLARHPLHDLDLTLTLAASDEYRARAAWDPDPPRTTSSLAGTQGEAGWFRSAVTVSLTGQDRRRTCCASGLAGTEYRLDATPWQTYTGPVTVAEEGRTDVSFRSHDLAGNQEAVRTVEVRTDITPPIITGAPTSQPNSHGWYRKDVTVRFVAVDATSGIASATTLRTLSAEGSGQSTVGRARDLAGNTATHRVRGISIDKSRPLVTITSPHAAPYANTDPLVVQWSVADPLSGVDRSSGTLDRAAVAPGQSVNLLLMAPTTHTVAVRAADRADNSAVRSVMFTVTVDAEGIAAAVREMRARSWITSDGTAAGLQALLRRVAVAIAEGKESVADAKLGTLLQLVESQQGRSITPAAADLLRADVAFLREGML